MTHVEACVTEVLKRGLDDWIQAAEVASVVQSIHGRTTSAEIRDVALEVIAELLHSKLMTAGDVTEDGFKEWSTTPTEASDRIARDWTALGRSPDLGEICWLSNTSQGDRRAQLAK